MTRPRSTERRDRGATLPIVALLLPVLILMTAFAVDLGHQRSSRRTMQARADIIALDLVRLTGSKSWNGIISDPGYWTYVYASAARNEIDPSKLTAIVWGQWSLSTGFQPCTVPANCTGVAGSIPTAVKVTATETIAYSFHPGTGTTTRSATAATDAIAGFQVGSKLLTVDTAQSVLLNNLMLQALGGNPALTAVGYQGLLNTTIPLGPLAAGLGVGTPDQLATSTVNAKQFYLVAAQVMQNQGNSAAFTALNSISSATNSTMTLDMGKLMKVDQGGSAAAANASVDLWSLFTGSVFAVDGTNTLSIPSATLAVPGATTTISLTVTQKPRFTFGHVGAQISTEQATIGLTTTLTNIGLSVVGLTGARVSGTIPLSLGLAGATGTLTAIDCGLPGITVGLTPQPLTVTTSANLTISANVLLLGNVPVATAIVPNSSVGVAGTSSGASFLYPTEFLPQVGTGTMKSAPTDSLTLPGPLTLAGGNITALGLIPIDAGLLATALNTTVINPVTTALNGVVFPSYLNKLLGIDIGGGDLGALDMKCDAVKLVD